MFLPLSITPWLLPEDVALKCHRHKFRTAYVGSILSPLLSKGNGVYSKPEEYLRLRKPLWRKEKLNVTSLYKPKYIVWVKIGLQL